VDFLSKTKAFWGGIGMLSVAAELFQPNQHSAIEVQEEQSRQVYEMGNNAPFHGEESGLNEAQSSEKQQELPDQ